MVKFEENKNYYAITRTGDTRILKVNEIIIRNNIKMLKGCFANGKEKLFVIENKWLCLADKEQGKPSIETVEVDKRYNLIVYADKIYL